MKLHVKITLLLLLSFLCFSLYAENLKVTNNVGKAVQSVKQLTFKDYPEAFNPSIVSSEWGYILCFRVLPDKNNLWKSDLGIVLLNEDLDPVTEPQLVSTRHKGSLTPQYSEDARLFTWNGKIYITYNDNVDVVDPGPKDRRDIFVAELKYIDGIFSVETPVKLFHETRYTAQIWQKNWSPFVWNNQLLMSYTINPHEVINPNLEHGECKSLYLTKKLCNWKWGELRGGTPAQLVDGEYLAFFHSANVNKSDVSQRKLMWHYYMGAYIFSANPPFGVKKMTLTPIVVEGFYGKSSVGKHVIFPGGYVTDGSKNHVAYGKNDCEVWVATFDKDKLMQHMSPVKGLHAPLPEISNSNIR